MATTVELTAVTGIQVVTDIADGDIPVLAGSQRQGDVIVLPADTVPAAATVVPPTGTPVVRAENGGNTHAVYAADGPVFCATTTSSSVTGLRVATLFVPPGSTAYLGHPEHGFLGIAPGSYEIRRQREQADQIRMVAD